MSNLRNTIVLVKKFNLKNEDFSDVLGGHLKVGEIYKAVRDENKDIYALEIEDLRDISYTSGIVLEGTEGNSVLWDHELTEVDLDNMLDLDLTAEQMNKVASWIGPNGEIIIEEKPISKEDIEKIKEKFGDKVRILGFNEEEESNAYDLDSLLEEYDILDALDLIMENNPEMYENIVNLIKNIASSFPDKEDN